MQRKSEVLQALKQFAKEIGAPTAIIADMAGEQMSQEVRSSPMTLDQQYGHWRKVPHSLIRLNCILGSSRKQSGRTCMNPIHQCAYGTTVWKDEQGSITSQLRTISSYME